MKIIGMMLVRNESWIVGLAAHAALQWCDELIVLDDGSTDATPDILAGIDRQNPGGRLQYHYEDRPIHDHNWHEMDLRQRLFDLAKDRSGTHYAVIDADEIPSFPLLKYLPQIIGECKPKEGISVPMISPYGSIHECRVDGSFEPYCGIFVGFRNSPMLGWKAGRDGYQHHHRSPHGCRVDLPRFNAVEGGIMHMQFASIHRLKVKAAYYKAFETLMYPGRMTPAELNRKYDWTLNEDGKRTREIPDSWWDGYASHMQFLDLAQSPWQMDALRNIVHTYGTGPFIGLDFHGLAI